MVFTSRFGSQSLCRNSGIPREAVRKFVTQLSTNRANSAKDTAPSLNGLPPYAPESMILRVRLALTEYAGLAFIPVGFSLYQYGFWSVFPIGGRPPSDRVRHYIEVLVPVFHWVLAALFVYTCYSILRYFVECGSITGRIKSVIILALYTVCGFGFWH